MRELEKLRNQVDVLRQRGTLDDATLARLRDEWRIEQIYETTGIEGNSLDLNETRMVIERGITISGKPPRDSREARNMENALQYLERLATDDRDLLVRDVRELQSLVVGEEADSGGFRTGDVQISQSDHNPPPPDSVPRMVQEVLDWLNASNDCPAPLSAAVVHAWIAHIHPFVDGNGRTARALMNLILIRRGYPIVLIRRKDRTRYYDALAASDDGDIAPLVDLIVKRSMDSLRQIIRVRVQATGVSEAVRRAEERVRKQYETWHQAMLLLLRSIEEAAGPVRDQSDGNIRISVREHDQVTFDDYRALLKRDSSGNGWLAVVRGVGYTKASELLLWNGYTSEELARLGEVDTPGGSVFVSEPDPTRANGPFMLLSHSNPFDIREIAFDGGNFLVLRCRMGEMTLQPMKANQLAMRLVSSFIDHYLS
ncbi:MAG: hypothetical protein QOD83_577 [Solirubrobacteraceae bacterium]|nr:hypothetical protein [Solirubrobacteraceae bacterium]